MSLRARLTLLYTSIVGGILLLFGTAVYLSVSSTLISRLDATLGETATRIIDNTQVEAGQTNVRLPELGITTGVLVQVWDKQGRLAASNMTLNRPLDKTGMNASVPISRNIVIDNQTRLRVLSVPLTLSGRSIGILQTAMSLSIVDATQRILLLVLAVGAALSMAAAGLAGWFSTNQALKPLEIVTQTALQITRADDLSRRIPYSGPPDDEVGQLIHAFNQTLERLENLFNTQRRFLADVGHELRTPLTVIRGNVDLMRRINVIDAESLDGIESEVDRLTRMVGDLLLLAQAESGKLPMVHQVVELDTLLLEAMQAMKVLARDRLTLKIGEIDQVLVCGDPDRLKQVLVNLISNAIKYTPQGGEVIVGLGKSETRARLTVSDDGPGIPAEDLPHIFERFYRGEKSRTRSRDGKGFGLGLSIAYWIVRNHGGQVEVSQRQPQGTTFCVWLPLTIGDCQESA